jgi:hypothetical protein
MTGESIRIVLLLFMTTFYLEYTCCGSGVVILCTCVRKYLVIVQCVWLFMSEASQDLNDLILKYDAV